MSGFQHHIVNVVNRDISQRNVILRRYYRSLSLKRTQQLRKQMKPRLQNMDISWCREGNFIGRADHKLQI